jgi:hypothetical protein
MRGAIPPPQYVFMAWCLVKHTDNFTFIIIIMLTVNVKRSLYCEVLPSYRLIRYFEYLNQESAVNITRTASYPVGIWRALSVDVK